MDKGSRQSGALRLALALGGGVLALGLMAALFFAATGFFTKTELERVQSRAALYQTSVEDALKRLEHLPFVLAQDSMVKRAAIGLERYELNRRLAGIAERADAEAIYLMDMEGLTVAASNYASDLTFLGQNYGFRPYFKAAAAGGSGEFYAIGATTARPGYFYSAPVYDVLDQLVAVLAVKVDLSSLTGTWSNDDERILVSNADGVVVLASDPAWRYRTVRPLPEQRREAIAQERQFGSETLQPLDWAEADDDTVRVQGEKFLQVALPISHQGWTLHFLGNADRIREQAIFTVITAAILIVSLTAAAFFFRSRRLRLALRASQEDRARLEREIEDRRAAERRLERAQSELQRASKLAALGELAASGTHERGQPISAMRNYIAAEELANAAPATGLLASLSGIVTRMENITKQLRFFAAPGNEEMQKVAISDVVNDALNLTRHTIEEVNIDLSVDNAAPSAMVKGNRQRLEQVLVNLLRNAVSAMEENTEKLLTIRFVTHEGNVEISVSDTGHGLNNRSLETLQEPFHTTRRSGEGMGLGLAISSAIVKEHNGRLKAEQCETGGARFSVILPMADTEDID
jgi:two-component system C4-dicarboxylate transport sensor histidine kinase DctB